MPRVQGVNLMHSVPLSGVTLRGFRAFEAGEPISACPFPVGTRERILYRAGWLKGNEAENPNLSVIPSGSDLQGNTAEVRQANKKRFSTITKREA